MVSPEIKERWDTCAGKEGGLETIYKHARDNSAEC